jgi:hypothetical protein
MKALPLPRSEVDDIKVAAIHIEDLVCLVASSPICYINMQILPVQDERIEHAIRIDPYNSTWSFVIDEEFRGAKTNIQTVPKYFDPEVLKEISVELDSSGEFCFDNHRISIGTGIIEDNLIESLMELRNGLDRFNYDEFYIIGVYNKKTEGYLTRIA